MAARFMVAAGVWNDTAVWSATTGGAPGASFPVAGDDANIDANSPAGTLTVNVASAATSLTVNKTGATVLFNATLTTTGIVSHILGSINTNGIAQTWAFFESLGAGVRAITLGASVITITSRSGTTFIGWNCSGSNCTLSAGTSSIVLSGTGTAIVALVTHTYNDVKLTGPANCQAGPLICATFTRAGTAVPGDTFTVLNTFTVTGALTIGGNTVRGANRLLMRGVTLGSPSIVTAGSVVIAGDVDFQDISLVYSGGASWTNAGNSFVGNALGNSATITANATPSATQTATGTTSFSWSNAARWTSRSPLPQDDVIINNAFSAGQTITTDMPRSGRSLNASTCTGSPTVNGATFFFGNMTLGAAGPIFASATLTMMGRGSQTFTMNGAPPGAGIIFNGVGGTYTFQDDCSFRSGGGSAAFGVTVSSGSTLIATGRNVTTSAVIVNNGGNLTGGNWILNGTGTQTVWSVGTGTITGAPSILITATDSAVTKTFAGGGKTYGALQHIATGNAGLTITGNNTYQIIDLECTTARTVTFPAGGTQTVTQTLILSGASGQLLSLVSSAPGTPWTISKPTGNVAGQFLSVTDSTATGGANFFAGSSTNGGGNTGWSFTTYVPPTFPGVGATPTPAVAPVSFIFELANSNTMSKLGVLLQARDRSLKLKLDKGGSFDFRMPLTNSMSSKISEVSTCVIISMDLGKGADPIPVWSGPVWTCQETTPNTLQVGCVGWLQTFEKRVSKPWWVTPWGNLAYALVDAGDIAFDLINKTTADTSGVPIYVTPGTRELTQPRTRSYAPFINILTELSALSELEAGYDMLVDPITRKLNIYKKIGTVKSQLRFEYSGNTTQVSRTTDSSKMCNRMIAYSAYGIAQADDLASQAAYGLFEEAVSLSDVSDIGILQAYANAEVAVRSVPSALAAHNFLTRESAKSRPKDPMIFRDFNIGDIGYLTAAKGRLQITKQAVRLFGATVDFKPNGAVALSNIQTSADQG